MACIFKSLETYYTIKLLGATFHQKSDFSLNQESDVAYIPTSGLGGENLVTRCQSSELTKWYEGKCLLEQIGEYHTGKIY